MPPKAKKVKDKKLEEKKELLFDMTDEKLFTLLVKELNKLLKKYSLSQKEIRKLKCRRRNFKNKEYAARRREKQYMMEIDLQKLYEKCMSRTNC